MNYIDDFLKDFPSLKIMQKNNQETILDGDLEFNLEYNGIRFYKKIYMKIIINNNYPETLPTVSEPKNILLKDFHKNNDGTLCLGTELELRKELAFDYSLKKWKDVFLNAFVFSSVYFEKYKVVIFGEQEHGARGELDSFQNFFNFSSFEETYVFIKFLLLRKYQRKLFKANSKIKKYSCPICNKKFYTCDHYNHLVRANNYFNKNILNHLKKLIKQYEKELIYVRYS